MAWMPAGVSEAVGRSVLLLTPEGHACRVHAQPRCSLKCGSACELAANALEMQCMQQHASEL